MFGGGGRVEECTAGEVKAFLIAGTIIASVMLASSWFTGQPECFLWPLRVFVLVWLVTIWWKSVKRLRQLKSVK
jgi:hypothetical protein